MFQAIVDALLLVLLVATTLVVLRMRTLLGAALLMGIYSFLSAGWMLTLDAPDVAFTEAAVGAGISTIVMLVTLSLTTIRAKRDETGRSRTAAIIVTITGAVLIYGTLDMPHLGDPDAPVHTHTGYEYIERSKDEIEVENVVTAVLGSYRGYDTLGETVVVFTAGMGVLLLLRRRRDEEEEEEAA